MSFREKRLTRTLAALGTLAVVAGALTGCSTSSPSTGSATSGSVTWWGATPDINVANRAIKAFETQYPKITVTYKKIQDSTYGAALRPALASNDGPDVFNTVTGGAGAAVTTYGTDSVDLTPAMVKLRGKDWKTGLYAAGIKDFTIGGQLKGAPVGKVASGMLWINKDLFDKYNVKVPTNLKQWVAACKTFRSNGLGCLKEGVDSAGFQVDTLHSIADSIQPGWWTKATDGKAKWSSATGVAMLKAWKALGTNGILDPGALGIQQYPDANNAFLSGKAPMIQMGTWYRQYTQKSDLQSALSAAGVPASTKLITMVPIQFPSLTSANNKPGLFGDPDYALSVNKKSKHVAAATTFALWLSSTKQGQQIIADNLDEDPVLSSVSANLPKLELVNPSVQKPYLAASDKQSSNVTQPRLANISATLDQAIEDAASTVLGGQATPQAAASTLQGASGQ